jgi:hypothetical protein
MARENKTKSRYFLSQNVKINERIARSENNINVDTSFNTNDMNCDYFLPNEVGNIIKSPNNQMQFSLLHLRSDQYYKNTFSDYRINRNLVE